MKRLLLLCACALSAFPAIAVERVVTLAPHLAELVCDAGGCDKLVGVVAYSDFPPQVARLPQVGDAFSVNFERVLALKPDLVLAWQGGGGLQTVARLRELGLRVESLGVRRIEDIAAALETLGGWLGTEAQAHATAEQFRGRLRSLRERFRDVSRVKVFYEIQTGPLYTINRESPISEAIELCGGVNVFAGLPALAGTVSLEAVFAADPDVVIYAQQDEAGARAYWRQHAELRAIAGGRLYPVDANLLARATPRMLEGVEQLCAALEQARETDVKARLPLPIPAGGPFSLPADDSIQP